VHAGDATNFGSANELVDFLRWFDALPHAQKVFVPGNHDIGLDAGGHDSVHCFWKLGQKNRP